MPADPSISQAKETKYAVKALTPLPAPLFTGLKLQNDVLLGSLTLNKLDSNNVIWICTNIDGWWTLPSVEFANVPKSGTDGNFDVDGRYTERQLELAGVILPPTPTQLPAARETLMQTINLVRTGAWLKTVTTSATYACYVRLAGQPDVSTVNARGRTEFSIPLTAADPVKYIWNTAAEDGLFTKTVSAGGSQTINNTGNYSVGAIFTITGPLTGSATITNSTTGDAIATVGTIGSGATLRINTYDRSVSLNGSYTGARAYLEPLIDWIKLQPGNNTIAFAGSAGSQLVVTYRPGSIG